MLITLYVIYLKVIFKKISLQFENNFKRLISFDVAGLWLFMTKQLKAAKSDWTLGDAGDA